MYVFVTLLLMILKIMAYYAMHIYQRLTDLLYNINKTHSLMISLSHQKVFNSWKAVMMRDTNFPKF